VCFAEIDFALATRWFAKVARRMGGRRERTQVTGERARPAE